MQKTKLQVTSSVCTGLDGKLAAMSEARDHLYLWSNSVMGYLGVCGITDVKTTTGGWYVSKISARVFTDYI